MLAGSESLRLHAAVVGRFYASGLGWALSLPVHELLGWARLMRTVAETERGT